MPRSTSRQKVSAIERFGGRCHFVEKSSEVYAAAQLIAAELGGHYLDQFTYAERAIDWRTGNIAESIFSSQDVGKDRVLSFFKDKPHRYSRYWALDRNACIHHCKAAAADGCHR